MNIFQFKLNPSCSEKVIMIGNENTPIYLLEDAIEDSHQLWESVCSNVSFDKEASTFYPGMRAKLPEDYATLMLRAATPFIARYYNRPSKSKTRVRIRSAFFSYVATPSHLLTIPQRVPHCDSNYNFGFAIMHYLSPKNFGGTGFFRHRPTGLERISHSDKKRYKEKRLSDLEKYGPPKKQYFTQSDDNFELIGEIEYKQNRLLVYPGNLLHSGLINPERDIQNTPKLGRVTANLFIDLV